MSETCTVRDIAREIADRLEADLTLATGCLEWLRPSFDSHDAEYHRITEILERITREEGSMTDDPRQIEGNGLTWIKDQPDV